jgi:outer membrane protein TolC
VKKMLLAMIALFAVCGTSFADEVHLIPFKEAERAAIKNSPQLIAQKYTADSGYEQARSVKMTRFPTLQLNAQSSLSSKIGRINIPTLGISSTVGDHLNWNISPTLNLIVWDTNQIINKAKSLERSADAQSNTLDYDKRQILLNARTSYIGVQIAKEQVRLVKESLALARYQYSVVLDRYNAGTSDRFDLTVADQEVADREKDLEQAEGELLVSKRALVAALAIEDEIEKAETVDVEPIKTSLDILTPRSNAAFDPKTHPQVKALQDQKASSELAAKSTIGGYFPEVTVQGSAGYQYPNLGANDVIQQNKVSFGLQMPIFEWGSIWKEAKSQKYLARSAEQQKRQTVIDLTRDVAETRDWIKTYRKLQTANVRVVKDAVDVARLSFDSYKAGRIIFLDVQRANVKELSAKVDAARNDGNLAIQIARLLALAEDIGDLNE